MATDTLVHVEVALFEALWRNGRVATIVELPGEHKAGDVIDVLCDEGRRECKATIEAISSKEGWTYVELTREQ